MVPSRHLLTVKNATRNLNYYVKRISRHFTTNVSHIHAKNHKARDIVAKDVLIYNQFISKEEEKSLIDEAHTVLKRQRYMYDHWDDAIHGYREAERAEWSKENDTVFERMKKLAFQDQSTSCLPHVHLLDIEKDGFIKPHIDSIRFCGNTIAGISLMSACVMRLVHSKDPTLTADLWLKRRSINVARYEFNHEVLKEEDSFFRGEAVPRDRRISLIIRNQPDPALLDDS